MPGEAIEGAFSGEERHNAPTEWDPGERVYARFDQQLIARLDAYCRLANRSRASAIRHLTAVALRRFEEEIDGQNPRPR